MLQLAYQGTWQSEGTLERLILRIILTTQLVNLQPMTLISLLLSDLIAKSAYENNMNIDTLPCSWLTEKRNVNPNRI